jgi:hypothetical protein
MKGVYDRNVSAVNPMKTVFSEVRDCPFCV